MVDSDTIRSYANDIEPEDPEIARMTRRLADMMDEPI